MELYQISLMTMSVFYTTDFVDAYGCRLYYTIVYLVIICGLRISVMSIRSIGLQPAV
jgi:hypothetical protein